MKGWSVKFLVYPGTLYNKAVPMLGWKKAELKRLGQDSYLLKEAGDTPGEERETLLTAFFLFHIVK